MRIPFGGEKGTRLMLGMTLIKRTLVSITYKTLMREGIQ